VKYLDAGQGPPVLLLHAFPLNHSMWRSQIAALSSRFRLVAPDIRGFGDTQPPGPWTLEELADDLAELLQRLAINRCAVVGLSMGGYIALPFLEKYPNRVGALVLANTRARADNESEKTARNEMIAALQQNGAGILQDRMLPRLLQPNPSPDTVRMVRTMMTSVEPAAAIYALIAMRDRPDRSTLLHTIDCPSLVISGENDAITRTEECRRMAETIPGAQFVQIENAGHLSNIENPEQFNDALGQFLSTAI
jgi:3-oxoadipate enol-lactonase